MKQVVTRSSVEAKFQAIAYGICELLWLKILLKELEYDCNESMSPFCDNMVEIRSAHNLVPLIELNTSKLINILSRKNCVRD